MRALVIYWSKGGNTEKAALAIQEGLQEAGAEVTAQRVAEVGDADWYAYDLVCIGFPVYQFSPPPQIDNYLHQKFASYRKQGYVRVGAPSLPGKHALVFCTYAGPHTGLREATPAVLYVGQYFEHLGFTVRGEWYVVGRYHTSEENSTQGRLGDIRGRPNAEDLKRVKEDAVLLAKRVIAESEG